MSKNTDQPKICKNPYCFDDTCRGECLECVPVTRTETCLSEDGEFTQYIEHSPLRSKYFYETTIGANYEKSKTKSFNKIQHRDTGSQSAKG